MSSIDYGMWTLGPQFDEADGVGKYVAGGGFDSLKTGATSSSVSLLSAHGWQVRFLSASLSGARPAATSPHQDGLSSL